MCYIDPLRDMNKGPKRRVFDSNCRILSDPVGGIARRFPPDGLLTSQQAKHDVELNPHIIEPDPFASDDSFNVFSPVRPFLLNKTEEEYTMNPGADELSSGLNGRLRPRKSNIPSPPTSKLRKSDGKAGQDKVKRTSSASKTSPNKTDDLATKSDYTFLCPFCDKNFASKQTLSKHVRRMHGAHSKQDSFISCLFCSHYEAEANEIVRHMAETHPQQYFACLNCHRRFSSSSGLSEHKSKACETKLPYRSRLRQKVSTGVTKEIRKDDLGNDSKVFADGHGFNGIVISCELKPSQVSDGADIEDNITTNLILPPSKTLGSSSVIEKNAVIVLDDIQWNKRIPPNFSFHNTDADQILSRLGVVHRSPRTGEPTKKDWKNLDDATQKFEKCFDTSFYSKVASNVQENLNKFLDGSFNFNPDPDSTIKTRKSKNSVPINTAEGFPILLASEQYSRNAFDRYMPRAIAPKHKWKWDNLEAEKNPINPDQIKRDSHTNNCIISLISSLDIWTQLRMRSKFEEKFGGPPLEKKTEKQTIISNELKDILESRELPTPSCQVIKVSNKPRAEAADSLFPVSLGLEPAPGRFELQPAVLSGEGARPRCYVCCACGAQSRDSRAVSAHVSTHHPNAQVHHYEIVGEQLLSADIVKHLYVPPSQMCNRTRPPRGFRECTKCRKSITLDDLHQHMLDCAGDTPAVRRKCRYRPFGVRRRRPRLPDNTLRKKIRKDIRSRRTRPKSLMRPRPIRTEVGDAETIRKMIADLPAKRHRNLVNPTNPSLRPRIKQRPKILMKRRPSEDRSKRKHRNSKERSDNRPKSPVNDGVSVKSDDENKPLKPKVRRVPSKAPRRSEPDKRNTTVLTRAKQRNRQVKKVEKNDNTKVTSNFDGDSKPVITDNISIQNSPKRIDINSENFKAREQAGQGQGNSNNGDGQRPGCSGQNSNSRNRCAPAQNVPLKHSIARLTADSEKHDKSVQFHHLFLVQQECNNINQHVQSGQQVLFENEAAVLTLDKPPLHYDTKGPLDSLQKSKLNKPRKGLNACIAMLKNKLVEPATESAIPAGHVSVQCGDDEPLYAKPDITLPTPALLKSHTEITTKPEKAEETSENRSVPLEIVTRHSSNQDKTSFHANVKERSLIITTSSCKGATSHSKPRNTRRESGRRRSLVNENKTIEMPPPLIPQADVPKVIHTPRSTSRKSSPVAVNEVPPKTAKQHNTVVGKGKRQTKITDPSKDTQHAKQNDIQNATQQLPLNKTYTTQNYQTQANNNDAQNVTKQLPLNKALNTQSNQTHAKQNEAQNATQQLPLNKAYNTQSKQTLEEKHLISEHSKPNDSKHQTSTKEKEHTSEAEQTLKDQSNVYYGNCLTLQQQAEYHAECEYNRTITVDNFPSPDFSHVPVNNQPAHASTHVESIVSIPLDLSGKVSNINTSQDLLTSQNTYLLGNSYDTYETLDLSNKSQDIVGYGGDTMTTPTDEIVDLSLKTSHSKSSEIDVTGKDDITDLSLKGCASIDIPTDLTVKKKMTNVTINVFSEKVNLETKVPPRKREVINPNKTAKTQNDNDAGHLPLMEFKNQDNKTGYLSVPVGTEDISVTGNAIKSKETDVPEILSQKVIENVPADLSCQQKTKELPKDTASCMIPVSSPKKKQDLNKIHDEGSSPIHQQACDKISIQLQKPIYDPTLIIPQYKIRAATTPDNTTCITTPPTTNSLVTTTSSPTCPLVTNYSEVVPNLTQNVSTITSVGKPHGIEDQLSFAYGAAPLIATNSNTGTYAITNCGVTPHSSKFESTTPVYTLANACISVTKIESSISSTLTNTLLSIPGTTIANITPVYTLAGTSIGIQAKYAHIVPAGPSNTAIQKSEDHIIPSTSKTQYEKELKAHKENTNNDNLLLNVNQDPETARKIALLPKELVDVLGKMPVDHRNRLLNILPQYVSTPMPDTCLKGDLTNHTESDKSAIPSEPKENTASVVECTQAPESKITTPLFIASEENKLLRMSNSSTHYNFENTPVTPLLTHPTSLSLHLPANQDESASTDESYSANAHRNSKDEPQAEMVNIKTDVISEDSFRAMTSNRLSSTRNLPTDKVIDLTEDEIAPRAEIQNEPTVDVPSQVSLLVQPKRTRSNNDQTASLRAVRIKTPSARQKSVDSQLVKYTSLAPVLSNKINNEQDNEVEKSLQVNVSLNTDISLAIQQAEVSSTQHSNKNAVAECKFPSVISPTIQESNLDEINNCISRRLSTASKDENIKLSDVQNVKSVVKATLVTSSIVNNEVNKESEKSVNKKCSILNSDVLDTKCSSLKLDISSDDNELTKSNPITLMESSLQSGLDISASHDLPIQSSTPKSKVITDKQTKQHPSTVCEDLEDSDDDLSLAIICKQKQQNLKTNAANDVNKSKKESDIAIKKKGKKNRKNVENINTSCVLSLSSNNAVIAIPPNKNKPVELQADIGEISSKSFENEEHPIVGNADENIKKKNRKTRSKKVIKKAQTNVIPKIVLTECDTNNVDAEINKEAEMTIVDQVKDDDSYNTVLKDDNKQSIGVSRKRSKVFDAILISETLKDHASEDIVDAAKGKDTPLRQITKKKKKTLVEHKECISIEISPLSKEEQKKNEPAEPNGNKNTTLSNQDLLSIEELELEQSKLVEKSKIISGDPSCLQETNNIEHVTPPTDALPFTSLSSLEDTSNMMSPLRRSRRGRSRNNSVAGEEPLNTESLQENRTPLTKKQLIFSKLLLDEENNIKNPDSVSAHKLDNLTKTPVVQVNQSNLIPDLVVTTIAKEKNKSVKRKTSPHLKRKSKKKKSFNSQTSCDEETVDSLRDQLDQSKDSDITSLEPNQKTPDVCERFPDHSGNDVPSTSISARSVTTDMKSIEPSENVPAVSIEKRKSEDLPHVEQSQSSQPKKSKLDITECSLEVNISQNNKDDDTVQPEKRDSMSKHCVSVTKDTLDCTTGSEKNIFEASNIKPSKVLPIEKPMESKLNESEIRVKTCYNMPAAGRRTRSKSAVIKSVVYDPYDIDMDDMIEHAEPLRHRKINSDYRPLNNFKHVIDSEAIKKSAISVEADKIISSCGLTSAKRSIDSYSKHDISDSDDSSKSDIPLKKYVQEKEKKVCDLRENFPKKEEGTEIDSEINLSHNQGTSDKKNRRTLGVCNNSDTTIQDETEQQLRSEQFMESFGFFSERKPRKSNLLATKKISETFHIIANESDDMYFGFKDRNSKKATQNENRKSVEREGNLKGSRQRSPLSKKAIKRGRKKKTSTTVTAPSYCYICKKDFRRSDNLLRHQMTLLHVSKMSEVEMKIKTVPVQEEPNYLIAYKEHLDRLKIITDKMLKRKKNSKSTPKIAPLSLEEILADVNKIVREQQLSHRGLSCDEELFLDCCELLKESHKKQDTVAELQSLAKDPDNLLCNSEAVNVGLDLLGKTDVDAKCDSKNDGDVDSLTAKTILESEEVRNLENDLISGLKEAANASNLKKAGIVFQQTANEVDTDQQLDFSDQFSSPAVTEPQYEHYEEPLELNNIKNKKYPEFKEKMYPDIEEIDMFEDKFDKIKRKCRSQAAAAKQPQLVVEPSISRKGRKKSDKKKGKKKSKKNHPSAVLTKGALKGFDGIKVSIPTSDINISAIVSPLESCHKKKKKGTSKKRRENKISESSSKYDSDHPLNDSSASLKNVDVYEFMDNEDVELFEFRPSTLMERFKSISNKDVPSTSKVNSVMEEVENSSVSASDGDDFVYMSDDYVCSDEETENSLMSCDVSNTKITTDCKKLATQLRKRDAVEKNAVMGKIFKNNAVRSEKKITKTKEPAKPKANLDQLFDSLLEDEPSSSMLNDESLPLQDDGPCSSKYENRVTSPNESEKLSTNYEQYHIKKKYHLSTDKENYSLKYKNLSSDNEDDDDDDDDNDDDVDDDNGDDDARSSFIDYGPSTSKLCLKSFIADHKSGKPNLRPSLSPPELKPVSPKKYDHTSSKQFQSSKKKSALQEDSLSPTGIPRSDTKIKKSNYKSHVDRSPERKMEDDFGISCDYNETGDQSFTPDETGVARQRARRKCTVGKQNILAETWSSESEPDGGPPRPNSAESTVSGTTRKKKGKKKDAQHPGGRRSNNRHISFKKQEIDNRVSSSNRNTSTHAGSASNGGAADRSAGGTLGSLVSERSEPSTSATSTSNGSSKFTDQLTSTPSTSSAVRSMPSTSAGPSTSTGCAAADPADSTFLVPAEPGTPSGVGRQRPLYYWASDGSGGGHTREEQAREQQAREAQARAEREERERQEREERARQEREREERAREEEAQQQQQQQQHGWIVGDSHKKLVTMLAHAKGRKRNNNNDDKRHKTD